MLRKILTISACLVFCINEMQAQISYNILDFGAVKDSTVLNTQAIQKTVDHCAAEGGGRVIIPSGVFMAGTIYLKSNVELWLEPQAVLKGAPRFEDYQEIGFIYAKDQENISIGGGGKLDGHGTSRYFYTDNVKRGLPDRPKTIRFDNCKRVRLQDFTLQNGATHCIYLEKCVNVTVDGINVISRAIANNDGIDIIDCHFVTLSNSYFDCGDDAICPKSESPFGVEDLTITNCVVKSESNGIKFGTSSTGGFRNVTISNSVIRDTRLSGIALEVVDGGVMDRVTINNITMHNVDGALFIKLGQRKGDKPGVLRNVMVNNLIADGIGEWMPDSTHAYYKDDKDPRIGVSIVGQPGYDIENITLSNVYFQFTGGGTREDAQRMMEDKPEVYPEFTNFGVTPAYGINCRHARNIVFDNVQLDWINQDDRPAMFFEDVKDISIGRLKAKASSQARAFVRLKDAEDVFIHDCKPDEVDIPFLSLEGKIKDISLIDNDLRKVEKSYAASSSVNNKEIFED